MWLNVANCGSHICATLRHLASSVAKWCNVVLKKKIFPATLRHTSPHLKYHFVVECVEILLNVVQEFYDKWSISTVYKNWHKATIILNEI